MLQRLIVSVALLLAAATPAGAEVLRFVGTFHTLYDCPDTGLGSACGSPPPVDIDIPFSFTMEITQPFDHTHDESSLWHAPEFPMPPPVTQALFESLSGHTFSRLGSVNTYENGPVFKNLLSYAQDLHLWTGTDAQGRPHNYSEAINVGFEGVAPRAQPGTPITFEEVVALWNDYRDTGRTVEVYSDVGWSILNPDGSYQAAGHRIHGDFRLCRAPGAIGGAVRGAIAAVVAKVRGS